MLEDHLKDVLLDALQWEKILRHSFMKMDARKGLKYNQYDVRGQIYFHMRAF